MAKLHGAADREQAVGLGGVRGLGPDPQPLGRPPHEYRVADRVSRGDHEEPTCVLGKRRQPAPEALLDPA